MNRFVSIINSHHYQRHFRMCCWKYKNGIESHPFAFILLVLIVLFSNSPIYAYDFQSGGIYYNIIDENNVAVTSGEYTGDILIPSSVTYGNKTYSVTKIGDWAFSHCTDINSITLPNSITSIGYASIYATGITSLILSNSLKTVDFAGLAENQKLNMLVIPESVSRIGGAGLLRYGSVLRDTARIAFLSETPPSVSTRFFMDNEEDADSLVIYVPQSALSKYQTASGWKTYKNKIRGYDFAKDPLHFLNQANGDGSKLPAGYTEVEYIENQSQAFIDTGFKPNQDTRIVCRTQCVTSTNYGQQCGAGSWQAVNGIRFNYESGAKGTLHVKWGTATTWSVYSSVIGDYNAHDYDWNKNTFYRDGSLVGSSAYENFQCTDNLGIFWCIESIYTTPDNSSTFKGKIFYFKLYDNGKIIRDFVPAKRNSDSKVGLYDVVNDVFYTSPNNKDFTAGPEVQNTSTKRTIHVATAGTLPNLISESEKYIIEELTLTGELNGTDFRLLRDMCGNNYLGQMTKGKLKILNMTNSKIVTSGGYYLYTDVIQTPLGSITCGGALSLGLDNSISPYLFAGCHAIEKLSIPNSVTSIKNDAFSHCSSLTSITIPNSVTSIENDAFSYCSSLTSITIPNSVTSIGGGAFARCSGLTSITIPNSVTILRERAFQDCSGLISLTIPKSVTDIGDYTFSGCCGLTTITIPNTVTNIGYYAFSNCSGLTSITIPNTVTSIGNGAFSGCSVLTSITISNSVTDIGDYTFSGCSGLTFISIPNSVTKIGYFAFQDCSSLTSITIPNTVTSIGNGAFSGCSGLTSITIPNSVTSIENDAFSYCSSLTSVIIPNSVSSIGYNAFKGCSGLTTVTIPNSVTDIGYNAFYECSGLTSITIPNSVTTIGNYAFSGCSGLKDVISEVKTPFEIYEDVFSVYTTAKLTVPKRTKSAYQSTNFWNKFTNIVEKEPEIIITANNYTRGYGDDNPTFEYTTSGGELNGTPVITCSATKNSPVGTYTIKIEQGSVTNSDVDYVDGTLTITKAPLTITAKSYSREEGQENPDFEVTYSGFKNGETSSVLTKMPTVSTTATKDSPAGTYDITVSGAEAQNYSFTYVNGTLTVTEKDLVSFTQNGITYLGAKSTLKANFQSVDNNLMNIEIPSTVSYDGKTYEVSSFANDALSNRTFNYVSLPSTITSIEAGTFNNSTLGALIWNAEASLSSDVFNNMAMPTSSNFLLYVNSKSYAPSNVSNVVVGNTASSITLADAKNTRFYCPKAFTAQTISYTHNYSMKTGGSGMGWETLALPFDVQKIEHKTKGTLTPFASYNGSSSQRPFWLYELGSNGFRKTDGIKANTPYIISMPNNSAYDDDYILAGDVTFSATNAKVVETGSVMTSTSNGKTFVPAFAVMSPASTVYALNVVNKLVSNSGSYDAGSRFISNMSVYPFEAYMTSSSGARYLSIVFEDETTGMDGIPFADRNDCRVRVYSMTGQLVIDARESEYKLLLQQLQPGVYIINGKKTVVKP